MIQYNCLNIDLSNWQLNKLKSGIKNRTKITFAKLASKNDIANSINKTDFGNKLKDITSNKNELNELSKIVKALSTKGLTKYLINKTYYS